MSEELLEKIPAEKRWLITSQVLTRFSVLRGSNCMPILLGEEEGIFSPVWGWEKWNEILTKIMGDVGKRLFAMVKETFNILVKDAVGAAKLTLVAGTMFAGAECKTEIVEATSERAVLRWTKCGWDERFNELGVVHGLRGGCHSGHQAFFEEGLKAINSNISYKFIKSLARGDTYCEDIFEFKED
jgi:hypothetical protein